MLASTTVVWLLYILYYYLLLSLITQNYTILHLGRLLNIQAHGEMTIELDTVTVLTLSIPIFCCLNAVNNYELTEIYLRHRYVFFDLGEDLEHRSIEFRRHVPCSDIKL